MKTKSGKMHFTADIKITESNGKIRNEHLKFCTKEPQKYIEEYRGRCIRIGNTGFEVINLINHDE